MPEAWTIRLTRKNASRRGGGTCWLVNPHKVKRNRCKTGVLIVYSLRRRNVKKRNQTGLSRLSTHFLGSKKWLVRTATHFLGSKKWLVRTATHFLGSKKW